MGGLGTYVTGFLTESSKRLHLETLNSLSLFIEELDYKFVVLWWSFTAGVKTFIKNFVVSKYPLTVLLYSYCPKNQGLKRHFRV